MVAKERGDDFWIEAVASTNPDGRQRASPDERADRAPRLAHEVHYLRRGHQSLPPFQFVHQCHNAHVGLIPVTLEIRGK